MTPPRRAFCRATWRAIAICAAPAAAGWTTASGATEAAPSGWTPVPINDRKPRTVYETVQDSGMVAVRASAQRSASLLMKPGASIDLAKTPIIEWQWKVLEAPNDADIAVSSREDAAARLILVFDGDRSRLPWSDRTVMAAADRLGSRAMPFATLMYVTAGQYPIGRIVPNPYTRRVQMLVADRLLPGAATGWREFSRDIEADYRSAFGETPGPLAAWGLMTDSDNTRSHARALYVEPRFTPRR